MRQDREGEVQVANAVFMFPGVGSHYSGMGKYFFDNFQVARETFEEASETLGFDMATLCLDKSHKAELDQLQHAQTALVTVSVATYRVFQQEIGLKPDAMLGYSLGEYSALCCAGAFGLSDALRLVKARGEIVSEHAASVDGTMAWVTNLAPAAVEEICANVSEMGEPVYVSAYDTPLKTSISGTQAAIRLAGDLVVKQGGIAIPIKMSGPFHSPIMQPAADRFLNLLQETQMRVPSVPVIANRNALPYGTSETVADNLYQQLVHPVRWLDSLRYLLEAGLTTAVEIGPKNVLQYLLQAVAPDVLSCTYDKEKDVRKSERMLVVQQEDYPRIIAQCLAVVAGTRNHNRDGADYERRVVNPFRHVQNAWEERNASGLATSQADVQEALQMMQTALEAKRVRQEERERHLRDVLGRKLLKIQA